MEHNQQKKSIATKALTGTHEAHRVE
jgi:hypothetical protein